MKPRADTRRLHPARGGQRSPSDAGTEPGYRFRLVDRFSETVGSDRLRMNGGLYRVAHAFARLIGVSSHGALMLAAWHGTRWAPAYGGVKPLEFPTEILPARRLRVPSSGG